MPYPIHKLLSYCKSHIYELHAILAAVISFSIMLGIKIPIKRRLADWIEEKAKESEKWRKNKKVYGRRVNLILMMIAIAVSYGIFLIVTAISPLIRYSGITAILSIAVTLDIYAVFEQILGTDSMRRGRRYE